MTPKKSHKPSEGPRGQATSCGYVSLVGAPNVGKSTLLNRLVGEELSIVTSKAQTTWQRVTGIRTEGSHQLIFLDTPGILSPSGLLHRSLLLSAEEAASEADVLVLIADPTEPLDSLGRERIETTIGLSRGSIVGVVNKIDTSTPQAAEVEKRWLSELAQGPVHEISAERGTGVNELLQELRRRLPEGPFLYPADEIAAAPVRFFVSEMVRQEIFEQFHQEVPYASICRVEEFRDQEEPTYIQATIFVERASQKGILIGEGGRAIRVLGTEARKRIETFLDQRVYLDLWVKVLPGWRRKPEHLQRLGLPVPNEDRARQTS